MTDRVKALVACLLLSGCASPSTERGGLHILCFHIQLGGSYTAPIVDTRNTLGPQARQDHTLPIEYAVEAATKATVTP